MKKLLIAVISLTLLLSVTAVAGAVNLTGRALGMGGAYTGLADDITGVLYNPAGLSEDGYLDLKFNAGIMTPDRETLNKLYQLSEKMDNGDEDILYYLEQIPEDFNFQGQALGGLSISSLGAALNLNNKLQTNISENNNYKQAELINLVTSEGIISVGQKLISPDFEVISLAYGVNFKLINNNLTSFHLDEEKNQMTVINGASGSGLGLDVGVKAKITELLTLGAQIRNLWVQDYEINGQKTVSNYNSDTGEWEQISEKQMTPVKPPVKRVTRVGAALKVPVIDATIAADLDNFPLLTEGDEDIVLHVGVEKDILFNGVSLRAGTYDPAGNQPRLYTVGIGVNLVNFHLDTAIASDFKKEGNIGVVLGGGLKF